MPERSINSTLRTSLLNNDGFAYAHLVKFEKPSLTSQVAGAIAGKATDYAYITDAAQDIVYNDGSTDSEGNANGAQTYRANRLVSVGTVSETTEARASNMALKLYATTLGTTVEDSLNISSGSLAGTVSFSDEGFREGDKVLLTGSGSNNGKYVIINAFSNAGKTLAVTPVDTTLSTESSATYTLSLASEEITALLLNKSSTGYASFLNREVYIYKAHLSADDNSIIGEPYLIFKGIVSNGTIQEKPDGQSTVTWNLTSHWGDFVQVRGRITSDAFHRALDPTGRPDADGLIRRDYANDLGFLHSEKAVNLITTYQVKEKDYRKQTKSGFLGFNKKISFIPYEVEVDREVDLRFNLQAKYLPVVYGVQRVDSIPFFVDTLVNDPKQVYVGYAIAEGQLGGIYDIYFDDTPSICIDKNDKDARSQQTSEQTIDVICYGRADEGYTLSGTSYYDGTFSSGLPSLVLGFNDSWELGTAGYLAAVNNNLPDIDLTFLTGASKASISGSGITHEKGINFQTPIDSNIFFHAGKPYQRANSVLSKLADSASFKIQNDYYDNTADYWGPNHRLLDTAYVSSKYTISEGETQIPELDFVVRGKLIDCYNYDYSYAPDLQNDTSHDESLFELFDSVTLHNTATNAQIGSAVQIIDKWSFQDENNVTQYRFRFSDNPSLGSVKQFYMKNTAGDRWYFETYDYSPNSGTVAETLTTAISTASDNATQGVDIVLDTPTLAAEIAFEYGTSLNLSDGQFERWLESQYNYVEQVATNTLEAIGTANSSTFTATQAIPADSIALASSASGTDDVYIGYRIRLTKFDANGVPYVQERIITDYIGSAKVAVVDSSWDGGKYPVAGDTYEILSQGDKRVSLNPGMQLLDYLTSPRYGKGLSLADDISLASFQDTARLCDTRSNVFMQAYANAVTDGVDVGDVFKYVTSSGKTVFQGKVKKLTYHFTANSTEVEFEDVVGKIARKWEDWKIFEAGDLYWHQGRLYVASANGKIGTPTSNNTQGTTTLTKVSGTGTVTNWLFNSITANFDGNPIVKAYDANAQGFKKTGYALYDADDVKYWRYVGWDAQDQRYVTRHQTNFVIDTAKPVFDNINGMLNHFNGILRYANGRYELDVESSVGVLSEAQYIDTDDIIGEIKITDSGQKGVFNSVSAAIPDPQNRFDNRTVTFFNSQYLKEDRGVPKQGNFNLPGVTNYFNARINVKQFLDQSRYSLSINFTMMPKGVLLLAGSLISITYPRFGWTNKLFRISNLNFTSECLAQVTAEEHNDDAYIISGFNKEYYNNYEPAPIVNIAPAAPTGLTATGNERGGITLTWTNGTNFNPTTFVTEVWRSSTNNRANATLIGTTKGTTFTDAVTTEGAVTRYYWIRHSVSVLSQLSSQAAPREVFSTWYPVSATAGESGTSVAILDAVFINLSRVAVALPSDVDGNVSDFSGSGTDIAVTQGTTKFEYDASGTPAANTFSVTATSPSGVVTFDSTPTTVNDGSGNPTIRRYDDITALSATAGAVVFTVTVNFGNSLTSEYTVTQSFSKVAQGVNGVKTALVYAYQRSASALTSDPGAVTVNLNTGVIITSSLANGWSKTIPSGTNPLYVVAASAAGQGDSDTIAANEWSDPVILSQDGVPGNDGLNTATVFIHQRTTTNSAPALPSGDTTYTFATGLTSFTNANGWTRNVPSSGGAYLWVSQATAASTSVSDTIEDTEWQDPPVLLAQDGETGGTGPRTASGFLYYQTPSTTAPSAPSASSYDFATGEFSSLTTGWDEDAPTFAAGNTNKYWYVRFTVEEATFEGSQTVSIGSVLQGIGFSGLVTFVGAEQITDGNLSLSFGATGTTTIDGSVITTGTVNTDRLNVTDIISTGNIVVGGDNISTLTNNAGYVDSSGAAAAAPVQSVAGATGAVPVSTIISAGNIIVTGDNVSSLTNDSAFINGGQVNSNVTSISGGAITTGTVAANRIDVAGVISAGGIIVSGDNISTLTNNAGYVNSSGAAAAAPVQSVAGATGAVPVSTIISAGNIIVTGDNVSSLTNDSAFINGGQVNSNVTSISGGAITTGTVAAARIDVSGVISAGGIVVGGDNITTLTNNAGYTDDTAANAAQSTANTANSTATAAQSTANTANSTATTANSRAQKFNTSGDLAGGVTVISGGSITVGNIFIDGTNGRILITD